MMIINRLHRRLNEKSFSSHKIERNRCICRCAVTDWSSFSPCSVACGQGITERRRWYINDKSYDDPQCKNIYLMEKRQCQGVDCNTQENKGNEFGNEKVFLFEHLDCFKNDVWPNQLRTIVAVVYNVIITIKQA
mgnify:FL=1